MAEQAVHQCEAINIVDRNAVAIAANPGIDAAAGRNLAEAAKYQIFLSVLDRVSSTEFTPRTVEIRVA